MRELEVNQAEIKHNQAKLSPIAHAVRLSIVGLGLAHGASQAATIEVTSNLDDQGGACTLRQAIVSLNDVELQGGCLIDSGSFGINDSITFSSNLDSNTILLTEETQFSGDAQLSITSGSDITINADNIDGGMTVDASSIFASRAFEVEYASLSLNNISISGASVFLLNGAGIWSRHSTINLDNCALYNNVSYQGGYVPVFGGNIFAEDSSISIINSTLTGDDISFNSSNVNISDSNLDEISVTSSSLNLNRSNVSRGVSANNSPVVNIHDSTISGGGVHAKDLSVVNIIDSTISGGGVLATDSSGVNIIDSMISGEGVLAYRSSFVIESTILPSVTAGDSSVVEVINSTISGRGVLANVSSVVNIINSTVSENSGNFGGAFTLSNSTLGLTNSTVSNNYGVYGGFLFSQSSSKIYIESSTVTNNSAQQNGDAIWSNFSSIILTNSIIANSEGGNQALYLDGGVFTSDSASIVEGAGRIGGSRSVDPGLLPLADNGGPTRTHALAFNSIARNTGDLSTCTVSDQRGRVRDDGDDDCDVGAYESPDESTDMEDGDPDSDLNRGKVSKILPPMYLLLLDDNEVN